MSSIAPTYSPASPSSRWMERSGWALTILVLLFLLMDSGIKLAVLPVVLDTLVQLGWPGDADTALRLGVILLTATALYAWPRTSIFGAILLTAYMGGAVATHMRVGSPLTTHILFGVYLGAALWAGLWLRSPALRALIPFKR